jgi:hypothetical protein
MAAGAADAGAWVVCVSGVEDWVVVVAEPDLVVATGFALFEATVFTFAVSAFPEGDEAGAVDVGPDPSIGAPATFIALFDPN